MSDKQNILVLGSGGREHALVWKLKQSPKVAEIHCIPGNGGIENIATTASVPLTNFSALATYVRDHDIDLTVVGPEQPLVNGIVDSFRKKGLKIWGPDQLSARLEGSKAYSKDFMKKYGIPTAGYKSVNNLNDAIHFLKECRYPIVIKASGLAAGKGVVIAESRKEALTALESMLVNRQFGDAGDTVVIEEFLKGDEISILVITDGNHYHILPTARDHKRAFDGDLGPNTGGMGAFAPAPLLTAAQEQQVIGDIIEPTIAGIRSEGGDYKGIIYFGLMIDGEDIRVLEYNCRFGDPEAQVILPLLKNDLLDLIDASLKENLDQQKIECHSGVCATVILASGGYPGNYEKNLPIQDKTVNGEDNLILFHAGTRRENEVLLSSGGRVLAVTALGENLKTALNIAYKNISKIKLKGSFYRKDIGKGFIDTK